MLCASVCLPAWGQLLYLGLCCDTPIQAVVCLCVVSLGIRVKMGWDWVGWAAGRSDGSGWMNGLGRSLVYSFTVLGLGWSFARKTFACALCFLIVFVAIWFSFFFFGVRA